MEFCPNKESQDTLLGLFYFGERRNQEPDEKMDIPGAFTRSYVPVCQQFSQRSGKENNL